MESMNTTIWHQGIGVANNENNNNENNKSMEFITQTKKPTIIERSKPRPQKDQALNCPRCDSTNTKFCYYNNYSLSQPRYFCKTCKRYWTQGGSIRNVPIGGNSRKNLHNKKSSSSLSRKLPFLLQTPPPLLGTTPQSNAYTNLLQNPNFKFQETHQDLNLACPNYVDTSYMSKFVLDMPSSYTTVTTNHENPNFSPLELLKNGMSSTNTLMNTFLSNTMYSSHDGLFPLQELKPTTNASTSSTTTLDFPLLEGLDSGGANASARLLFPLQVQSNDGNTNNDGRVNLTYSRSM